MTELETRSGHALLPAQRRSAIVEQVQTLGGARMADLTLRFGVSDVTVRRDLELLARDGLIGKVHGGAIVPDRTGPPGPSPSVPSGPSALSGPHGAVADPSQGPAVGVELRIAVAAAALVPSGGAIALSAGPVTYALARQIVEVPDLTVVTNSPRIADLFVHREHRSGSRPGPCVILTGGTRLRSGALVGPVAERTIRSLNFDVVFLGCLSLSTIAGLSTANLTEAQTNRALVDAGQCVVALADHTTWGHAALSTFAPLRTLDVWVTDSGLSDEARAEAAEHVCQILLA